MDAGIAPIMNTATPSPPATQPAASETESYYEAHRKIYPREVKGRFATLRNIAVWVLLGLFYGVVWLQWNGRQAVLFDLPARKFYLFGLTMWPQDFIFLSWLLIIAALSLFFFTAIGGRLWCGYACPQTVWTEAFLWLERFAEGDRSKRMKLDKAPWSAQKLGRKGLKQFLWIAFAAWTGFTFVGYFSDIRGLGANLLDFSIGPWEAFWVLFYGFATYGNAGYMREQVCKYMCPYARFQSAMFDRDTLIITYDAERGEPRGSRRRGEDPRARGLGDCTDCTLCVQVCPTGIDIRKGLQYECIACAMCIDACDSVMDRMGYPRGLVRYATQHSLEHKKTRVLRPRVIIYAILLALLTAGFVVALAMRTPVALDAIHDRNTLYRLTDEGKAQNVYTLKIMNKEERPHRFRVSVTGSPGVQLAPPAPVFEVAAGEVYNAAVRVERDAFETIGNETIRFTVTAEANPRLTASAEARFFAPAR
jgi:cytochrome c oxidase accessory protein FixG